MTTRINEKLKKILNVLEIDRTNFEKNPKLKLPADVIAEKLLGRKSENFKEEKSQ